MKLIDAAIIQICEVGYAGITVGDVAARAGLTRGAVQHHFGNVDDLCLAVVDEFGNKLEGWSSISSSSGNPSIEARVSAVIDSYWDSFRNRHFVAVMLIWFGMRDNKSIYSELARRMSMFERKFDREWHSLFADTMMTRSKIAAARHIVLSALRGLAFRTLYRKTGARGTEEIVLLKKMLVSTLKG